jgi:hypothetical protein
MYTSMLDISTRNKNLSVAERKLTETCNIACLTFISYGTNMLCTYLGHIIYVYRLQAAA